MNRLKTLAYACGGVAIVATVGPLFRWRLDVAHGKEAAAKRQIEALQAKQRPRRVAADQAATLVAELHGTNIGLINVIYANCADCAIFKNDLVRALRMAGATIPDAESGLDAGLPGVIVFVPDLEHPSPEASALSAALQRAGIDAQPGSDPASEYPVTLYVGHRP